MLLSTVLMCEIFSAPSDNRGMGFKISGNWLWMPWETATRGGDVFQDCYAGGEKRSCRQRRIQKRKEVPSSKRSVNALIRVFQKFKKALPHKYEEVPFQSIQWFDALLMRPGFCFFLPDGAQCRIASPKGEDLAFGSGETQARAPSHSLGMTAWARNYILVQSSHASEAARDLDLILYCYTGPRFLRLRRSE